MQKIGKKIFKSSRKGNEEDFLLSITVYEVKNLRIQHLKSFIEVSFGGKVKTTRVAKSSSNPHFNEYMVFETRCTLDRLLTKSVTFKLYHEACLRRCSGELVVDLDRVWKADGRGFRGVWGRLVPPSGAIPSGEGSDSCGIIKFDLVIVSDNTKAFNQFDHQLSQVLNLETDRQRILLNFNLYRGTFPTMRDHCVRLSLCGVDVCSRIARMTEHPEWNQQFQFMWFFPELCGNFGIKIESPASLKSKTIAKVNIFLRNLSHMVDGEATLPTFGPAWWHLYKSQKYRGRILFSIEATSQLQTSPFSRSVKVNGINRFFENDYWTSARFRIHLGIVELDFLHSPSRHIRLKMVCAEDSTMSYDLLCTAYDSCNLFFLELSQKIPTISLNLILPDLRHILRDEILIRNFTSQLTHKLTRSNLIDFLENKGDSQGIVMEFLEDTEVSLKSLKKVLSVADDGETLMQWHVNFRAQIVASLEKLIDEMKHARENIDLALVAKFLDKLLQNLHNIAKMGVTKWPDLMIKLEDDQGQELGVHRVDLKDIVYLNQKYGGGYLCRKRHGVIFKNSQCRHEEMDCGCISGHGDIILWMGGEKEDSEWWPNGWKYSPTTSFNFIESPVKTTFRCTIYLYQAKIEPGLNRSSLYDTFVDIFFSGIHGKSTIHHQSLVPNWNEVVSFENITLNCEGDSYVQNPPILLLKLFHGDKKSDDFLGLGYTIPRVSLKDSPQSKSKLKWIPILRNGLTVAQLLLSVDLEETSEDEGEKLVKVESSVPKVVDAAIEKFHIIFTCFGLRLMDKINKNHSQIFLEFGNSTLSMRPCSRILGRSCNFVDCVKSCEVYLPEKLSYWPPIVLKHRREKSAKLIGITVISNAQQFFRENQLRTPHKENSVKLGDPPEKKLSKIVNDEKVEGGGLNFAKSFIKSTMSSFLNYRAHVEENASKNMDIEQGIPLEIPTSAIATDTSQKLTWWLKFFNSVEENSENFSESIHKLKIYQSELENQPEFGHFRDWADVFEMVRARKQSGDGLKRQKYCFLRGHIEILKDSDAPFTERLAK